jgi:flagellar protein FliO/FliZ
MLLTVLCGPALAQSGDLTGRNPWALLGQALLSLAVVVGVIYLVYFGLRRLGARHLDAAEGPLRVAQSRHLGGDRWLYLVEVEGRRIVVGATDGGLTTLAELEPSRVPDTGGAGRDEA